MHKEYQKVLVCKSCFHILSDADAMYQNTKNGMQYVHRRCNANYQPGLIITGVEAIDDCLNILEVN
ncbi:hypothetical protein [Aliikangiella coralliicola]|uniref:Uncharacterized protein n=1 Tax=Aliikangiella coralliicola TaxID=2592383 RepID=A0A545U4L0_9GAMM|nr:hypothetical protein [Aliikangiella coralliicola]TQV84384.1 hypothetical protein FLL46_22440 [Aliikangiella coralliicola]